MNLKKINRQNRNRIIDTENVLMVVRWEGFRKRIQKGEGIKKYKLVVKNSHRAHSNIFTDASPKARDIKER